MRIAVIGGGPSGIFAAGMAAKSGHTVILFEKNEKLGKKVYITGKGRCNISNEKTGEDFLRNVVTNAKFLYSAINAFSAADTVAFFAHYGVLLKTERGGRMFPQSDKSSDILKAFNRFLEDTGVEVRLNEGVLKLSVQNGGFEVVTANGIYTFDKVVIATGGMSYQNTGSTGDGYRFAKQFGICVQPLFPALVPIELADDVRILQGLSLKNVRLTFWGQKPITTEIGEMLFMDDGITGPLVLTLSSFMNKLNPNKKKISIDLKPALSAEEVDMRLQKDLRLYQNKDFQNTLDDLLPKSLIPFIVQKSNIDKAKKGHQVTKEERSRLVSLLKCLPFTIQRLYTVQEAIITSGGIAASEISPKTFESKKVPGLYFVGEVLDVDALTGGYNLQIAMSVGYLCGKNI